MTHYDISNELILKLLKEPKIEHDHWGPRPTMESRQDINNFLLYKVFLKLEEICMKINKNNSYHYDLDEGK